MVGIAHHTKTHYCVASSHCRKTKKHVYEGVKKAPEVIIKVGE